MDAQFPGDASVFYALLRYEEAATALRAVLGLKIVDRLGERSLTAEQFGNEFGFQPQATRSFGALLKCMHILCPGEDYQTTTSARRFLAESSTESRGPYLSMGADASELIAVLRGESDETPLYAVENEPSLMEDAETSDIAEAVAYGLASRARAFAEPLADVAHAAITAHADIASPTSIVDLGAGSPYVALAMAKQFPSADRIELFDRQQGLTFARQMSSELNHDAGETAKPQTPAGEGPADRLAFVEGNIFSEVPSAQLYCLSNTAHDWLPQEYTAILQRIGQKIEDSGCVVIHEPLLETCWDDEAGWQRALWMACYAVTLLKLTGGKGTCYSLEEHDSINASSGFERFAGPAPTADGCTALLYRRK